MTYLKMPPIKAVSFYKTYGNKYIKIWRDSVTKDDYITAYICGEKKVFPATQDGVNEMESWINEKREEIAKKLHIDVKTATCKNITGNNPVDEFICSECGFACGGFHRINVDEDGDEYFVEFEIKYCPTCGAKVVEE